MSLHAVAACNCLVGLLAFAIADGVRAGRRRCAVRCCATLSHLASIGRTPGINGCGAAAHDPSNYLPTSPRNFDSWSRDGSMTDITMRMLAASTPPDGTHSSLIVAVVVDLLVTQPLDQVNEIVLIGDRDDLAGFDHFGVADHLSVESLMWEESQEQGEGTAAVRVVC